MTFTLGSGGFGPDVQRNHQLGGCRLVHDQAGEPGHEPGTGHRHLRGGHVLRPRPMTAGRRGDRHADHPHGQRGRTSTYGQSTNLTGTLTNTVTGAPISGQRVTLTLNGAQSCSATTNAQGIASCPLTPNEPAGTYTVSGSFGGSTTTTTLLPTSGHNCEVVNKAPTVVTYTGPDQHRVEPDADPELCAQDLERDPDCRADRGRDARNRALGPELHGRDQLVGCGLLQRPGQPGLRLGNRHRLVRRATPTTRHPPRRPPRGSAAARADMAGAAAAAAAAGARAAAAVAVRAAAAPAAVAAAGPCLLRRLAAWAAADRSGRDCGKDQR